MFNKAFLAATAAMIVATPAVAQQYSPGRDNPMQMAGRGMPMDGMPARDYVKMAGASDLFERQSAQLVLASTRNPGVRRFANMMIKAHSDSTIKVKRAAMRDRVPVGTPSLDRQQMRMIADLRMARGPRRDALYIQQQKEAHRMALDLQSGFARDGRAPALRMTAGQIVPVVQMHIDMLGRM